MSGHYHPCNKSCRMIFSVFGGIMCYIWDTMSDKHQTSGAWRIGCKQFAPDNSTTALETKR